MEKILTLTEQTTTTATTELEMLEQINNNLVVIGETQNVILGLLVLFGLYGMYKALSKLINMFL